MDSGRRGRKLLFWGVALLAGCDQRSMPRVTADGSSTVGPITTAAAELFTLAQGNVDITVGVSGTGGGFKKFLDANPELRTDINNASRPIAPTEIALAHKHGIEFIELKIAMDGIAIVVHPSNDFCKSLTVAELKRIWEPGSQINNWHDIRPEFPDRKLALYGPGTDSGTFDYFTHAIMGKEKLCRGDYTASETDNVLVQGVSGDPAALGYFGFSFYEANARALRLVPVDPGTGVPIAPSTATIFDGSYRPLARPLFIYVNAESARRPAVASFVRYFLDNAKSIVEHPRVAYVSLPPQDYAAARKRFDLGMTGVEQSAATPTGGH